MQKLTREKIQTWVFDLDNTLYPSTCNLFAQIDQRMGAFISSLLDVDLTQARKIQKQFYYQYGTTLSGLMQEHHINPFEYLDYVHDIDHSSLPHLPELKQILEQLPGRKFIFTNGSRKHGEMVADKLGILSVFEDIFDIVAADFKPKPGKKAYLHFLDQYKIAPHTAIMFEDLHHNLQQPHKLGMTTVLVKSDYFDHPRQQEISNWEKLPEHIHHQTDDLLNFLKQL